jgi:hypothetical protein
MNFVSNFYKLIIIILLIIILIKIINNINESFNVQNCKIISEEERCNNTALCKWNSTNNECLNNPKINFTIKKYNNNSVEIYWDKPINKSINKYILIYYINNNGPYLKIINNDKTTYIFNNLINNITYKIGLIGIYDDLIDSKLISEITNLKDNIKEFSLSSFKDDAIVKYTNSFQNSIICDKKGQHKIISNCPKHINELDDIAKQTLNKSISNKIDYFDENRHNKLMANLNKKNQIHFNLEFKM